MPLHDWSDDRGWDSVHQLWIVHLLFSVRQKLPAGYRAYLGSVPRLTIAAETGRPDLGVRSWQPVAVPSPSSLGPVETSATLAPDYRGIAMIERDPQLAVQVARHGQLVAAIELVSPATRIARRRGSITRIGTWATSGTASTCCWWISTRGRWASRSPMPWPRPCTIRNPPVRRPMRSAGTSVVPPRREADSSTPGIER